MKNSSKTIPPFLLHFFPVAGLLLLATLFSCQEQEAAAHQEMQEPLEAATRSSRPAPLPTSGNLVEVETEHMNFIMPDEIPAGWTTFRYQNKSMLEHFMSLDLMPVHDGKQMTIDDFKEVAPIYQDAMDLINIGKAEEGYAEFGRFPAWFSEIVFWGGVGLVSPGNTAQTTLYLAPGVYVVECYVKTGGKFHPMAKQLIVTEEPANGAAPKASLNISISKDGGIEAEEQVRPGLHTVAVHFKDQAVHEHFLGHDVHLVKLEASTDLKALDGWMNWAAPEGLNTPAPATFLGGTQQMPAGNTAYFTVQLKPGRYAWIAEVPAPLSKNMLKTFTVPFDKQTARKPSH